MNKTHRIAFTAVFTAMVAVATVAIAIPLPKTQGFLNFGDAVIFVTGIFFGPFAGLIAGGFGSAAADLILGYSIWAPFSFVIKGAEGLVVGLVSALLTKTMPARLSYVAYFIAMLTAAAVMIAGYFFATAILYGFPVAMYSIVEGLLQGGISIAIALVLLGVAKTVLSVIEKRRR